MADVQQVKLKNQTALGPRGCEMDMVNHRPVLCCSLQAELQGTRLPLSNNFSFFAYKGIGRLSDFHCLYGN